MVICADSFEWLPASRNIGSIVTSLPDASEIGMDDLDECEKWVRCAATEIFLSASEGCPVIFVQTDRRKGGRQFSKANLLMNIAAEQGWKLRLTWCRNPSAVRHGVRFRRGEGLP